MLNRNKTAKLFYCRILFILGLVGVIPVYAASLPGTQEFIQLLGIQQQDIAKLEQGEIVSFDVTESNEKELAAGGAIYLTAAPSKIIAVIKKKGMMSLDSDITAQGTIPPQAATLDTFKGFAFNASDKETTNFLKATPGDQFNLSTEEFQALKVVSPSQPDAASQAYR